MNTFANLGSTSLKYRLFDFSPARKNAGARRHRRVTDYAQAIDHCLAELKQALDSKRDGAGGRWLQDDYGPGCERLRPVDETGSSKHWKCATHRPSA